MWGKPEVKRSSPWLSRNVSSRVEGEVLSCPQLRAPERRAGQSNSPASRTWPRCRLRNFPLLPPAHLPPPPASGPIPERPRPVAHRLGKPPELPNTNVNRLQREHLVSDFKIPRLSSTCCCLDKVTSLEIGIFWGIVLADQAIVAP